MQTWNILVSFEPIANYWGVCGYLDPGTGSYALQLFLAGAFGGLFVLKQSWRQCRDWLTQLLHREDAPQALEATDRI